MPPPTTGGSFLASFARIAGYILVPFGLIVLFDATFVPRESGSAPLAWILIIGGVALFVWGKIIHRRSDKYVTNPEQRLTVKRLLQNPDFVVYVRSPADAKLFETDVRQTLADTASLIRESGTVPSQTSYEL